MRVVFFAAAVLVTAISVRADVQQAAAAAQSADFFEARVRPILAANCYECHAEEAKGDLRVDSREGLLKGGESGPAIVVGDPDKSLLIQAVRQSDPSAPRMPKNKSKLKPEDIEVLVEWVRAGAVWPASSKSTPAATAAPAKVMEITAAHREFWSVRPLSKPVVPSVKTAGWAKTDIDRFILARLEKDGLRPVAMADKLALIRRVTLDLTGVPPTPEEVDAFTKDGSADAFAKLVDRLLASPRYGETWGRVWLDVARYGEDDYRSLDPEGRGYNPYPNAYLYRDWVIKAFNDDMPYADFVRAQLAADLLDPSQRVRNVPALGFLGLGPWYYDNGAVEITRADERHDRVDAVSRGFLGLTVGCARCHDHKYDPIPTSDYYGLAGVFLNTEYHEYPQAPQAIVDEFKAQEKKIEKKQELLGQYLQKESEQLADTLAFQISKYMVAAWRVSGEPKDDKTRVVESQKLDYELFDRYLRFLDKPPTFYPYLKAWQEMVRGGGTEGEAKRLAGEFQDLVIDVLLARRDIKVENDIIVAKALPGTKPKERLNKPNAFVTNDDFCPGCGLELKSMPIERTNLWTDVFSRDLENENNPAIAPKRGLLSFGGWGLERQLGPDRRALIQALRDDIESMEKAMPEPYPYVHGVHDLPTPPVNLKVAIRGSQYRSGAEVPRGFLSVLGKPERQTFTKGSGRLELAEAIVQQPITARVIVNRIWKGHFGTGLVDTPSNFGVNGERPSHPELLEYLAQYFIDHGMSIKALHREILRSTAYQLSTANNPANFEKDAGNRLYWRANRSRLTAEQLRDSVLFVAGSLESKMGGPATTLTPLSGRRTIYGRVSRYRLDEFLQLFDFPSPMQSAEKRFNTNVPLQRLFLMNSDFMQQQAERLAERVIAEPTDLARITKAYRLIFGRTPTADEVKAGLEFLEAEPMRQYEERKAKELQDAKDAEEKAAAAKNAAAAMKPGSPEGAKPAAAPGQTPAPATPPAVPLVAPPAPPAPGDGMMAGVVPGAPGMKDEKKKPVTAFGRYVKILLSSNEFLFLN
ncbi:MAG TPA: PSD1 and planctomycete cytochrome C domain-containing protein [Vicinamibacterales bacterium]|nr:PSD1 and planctomycete cytochrome C domain-containing protein [Vicinamibacterales bacterium]